MIRFQSSMQLKRGRLALNWAKERTEYMNAVHGKPSMELFRSRFGNVSTIYWIADFEDLAALQTRQQKVGADPGYRELANRSLDIVIEQSIEDTVLESV